MTRTRLFIGDLGSTLSSLACGMYLLQRSTLIADHFPPFASMQAIFFLNSCFMACSGYFFCGNDLLSGEPRWGYLGLIMSSYSITYMIISIILTVGLLVTTVLMGEVFPSVVPAVSSALEPIISLILIDMVGIEPLPGSYSCLSCALIMPGMVIIIVGNYSLNAGKISVINNIASPEEKINSSPRLRTKLGVI
jgi:hypothetical protein